MKPQLKRRATSFEAVQAKELAAKAVVLIDPCDRAGEIVWPADIHSG
jgi:hypothetical protein